MAGIDYTIPGQIKGIQVESPLNAMAQAMQLRNLQESSQMNALKLQEAQREAQERNAITKLDPSSADYIAQLTRINPKLGIDLAKARFEAKSAETTQQKHEADLFQARLRQSRFFLENIDPNSPIAAQQYLAWHTANHKDPVLGPVLASRGADEASARARIDEAIKTGKLSELIMQSKLGMEKFIELTPAFNKAENEQIDYEFSDYLNNPKNPPLTRLQFIEFRKRQQPAPAPAPAPSNAAPAPAPSNAAPAPAPSNAAPAPAPSNAVPNAAIDSTVSNNLLPDYSDMVITKEPSTSTFDRNRPRNKTEPMGFKRVFTEDAGPTAVNSNAVPANLADRSIMFKPPVNNLGGGQAAVAPVNNLNIVPAFTTANNKVEPVSTTTTQTAVTDTVVPQNLHPDAARLFASRLPSDKAKAEAIQRVFETQQRSGAALSDIAQMQDDRAKALQRGDKKSANEITARINKLIKTDEPPINPAQTALISKAILEGRLDPAKVNSRNMAIIANTLEMDPNANLKELNIDSVSATAASKTLAVQQAKILTAANEADKMIGIVKNNSAKLNLTQYPNLNAIQNAVDKGTGGKEIVALNTAINALINAYARAINPNGVATVRDKNHAEALINSNLASGQLSSALAVMQEEMRAAIASPRETSKQLKEQRSRAVPSLPRSAVQTEADAILKRTK